MIVPIVMPPLKTNKIKRHSFRRDDGQSGGTVEKMTIIDAYARHIDDMLWNTETEYIGLKTPETVSLLKFYLQYSVANCNKIG